jgi:hypothetical protein
MREIERYEFLNGEVKKSCLGNFIKFSDYQLAIRDRDDMIADMEKKLRAAREAIVDMDESFFVDQWTVCDSTMSEVFIARKEILNERDEAATD